MGRATSCTSAALAAAIALLAGCTEDRRRESGREIGDAGQLEADGGSGGTIDAGASNADVVRGLIEVIIAACLTGDDAGVASRMLYRDDEHIDLGVEAHVRDLRETCERLTVQRRRAEELRYANYVEGMKNELPTRTWTLEWLWRGKVVKRHSMMFLVRPEGILLRDLDTEDLDSDCDDLCADIFYACGDGLTSSAGEEVSFESCPAACAGFTEPEKTCLRTGTCPDPDTCFGRPLPDCAAQREQLLANDWTVLTSLSGGRVIFDCPRGSPCTLYYLRLRPDGRYEMTIWHTDELGDANASATTQCESGVLALDCDSMALVSCTGEIRFAGPWAFAGSSLTFAGAAWAGGDFSGELADCDYPICP